MTRAILLAVLPALLCASCGSDDTMSPSPTPPTESTETFIGNLDVHGSQFYSFTVTEEGTTNLTLLGLRPSGATFPALTTPVGLGIGTPAGTGCAPTSTMSVQPGLTTQMSTPTTAAIHCVNIYDTGNLTGAVNFVIRIVHP
jgi:hypothetical protein